MSTATKTGAPVFAYVVAGPVPAIVWPTRFVTTVVPPAWPLTVAVLLTIEKSETSIRVAKTMLVIVVRLWFTFMVHSLPLPLSSSLEKEIFKRAKQRRGSLSVAV